MHKDLLFNDTHQHFNLGIISVQWPPGVRREVVGNERVWDSTVFDSYVEVSTYVPDWPHRN